LTTTRPTFVDGTILAAADLGSLEATGRDRDARHARHLHTPGVGAGLTLVPAAAVTQSGRDYVDVTMIKGYAVDGTGRELVVADDVQLSPDRFRDDNPNPPLEPGETFSVWHPVFVRGFDQSLAGAPAQGQCANGPGRGGVEELVEVEFGRPGDSDRDQTVPAPEAGAGSGAWRVLVGFVRFDPGIGRFTAVAVSADGVAVTGAGAAASLVAGTGRVEVRARRAPEAGVPAVLLDSTPAAKLTFGTHDGTGGVAALMTVDSSGNLTVTGTLEGVQTAGSVRVVSGTASDGTVLPLPDGVDQAAVDAGGLQVSVLVSPHLPPPRAGFLFVPSACEVDADRRVSATGDWLDLSNNAVASEAASCDFLVLVSVKGGAP
jgi:hypothetical protein